MVGDVMVGQALYSTVMVILRFVSQFEMKPSGPFFGFIFEKGIKCLNFNFTYMYEYIR